MVKQVLGILSEKIRGLKQIIPVRWKSVLVKVLNTTHNKDGEGKKITSTVATAFMYGECQYT
jgi:hypothetical protein